MSEVSKDVKVPLGEIELKGALAKGKGISESFIKEQIPLIPDKTPGRDASIRPRSPFRELKCENWSNSSAERSSQPSVRISDSNIRSVYTIEEESKNNRPSIIMSGSSIPQPYPMPTYMNQPWQQPPQVIYVQAPPPPAPVPQQEVIPDYENMPADKQQEARIIFKSKFAAFKERYPTKNFEAYIPEMPLKEIHKIYNDYLRNFRRKTVVPFQELF